MKCFLLFSKIAPCMKPYNCIGGQQHRTQAQEAKP